MKKKEALLKFLREEEGLELELGDISPSPYIDIDDDNGFSCMGLDYLVLTDEEADRLTKEEILDNLWTFGPEFLEYHTCLSARIIKEIQEELYRDADEILRKLIDDIDHFVEDAIAASYGRGHFLSTYDGVEHEMEYGGEMFYIYRID